MRDNILYFYGYIVFFYSLLLISTYVMLLIMSYKYSKNYKRWTDDYIKHMVDSTPYVPGVSIVAPAFNESKTIIDNVNSLLNLEYPNFEICIVNDGSKDDTLQKLIDNFDLVEVSFEYVERIHCAPFRHLYRSTNFKYQRLVVVDKVNGGTKADAVNAGLNVITNPYFINTDVDCVLSRDAIYHCVFPALLDDSVIAVSGTMSMSNGSTIKDGVLVDVAPSSQPIPLFQDLEYKRSFLVGKMGWSYINAMNNVSGGYGLFNTEVVIAAGGYGTDSFAEDMDMLTRMIAYCCDFKRPYRVVQIPHNCCWTEGPSSLRMIYRQRVRWGRGLIQLMHQHHRILFNPRYKRLGLITFPNTFLFEFLAPVIESVGFFTFLYLAFTGAVNWSTFFVMFFAIYSFSYMLSSFVVFYDFIQGKSYTSIRSYIKLFIAALFEPIIYHPIIVYCSLVGYYKYITKQKAVWVSMERKGMKKAE
ncbi:MAG: glycosyltransferase family 2 protein [Prevotellaceae bacterium]|nr:glycosyltransferase family 2 protein [Candidatus Minthosoma caballi]